jgi:hypothetical protein
MTVTVAFPLSDDENGGAPIVYLVIGTTFSETSSKKVLTPALNLIYNDAFGRILLSRIFRIFTRQRVLKSCHL